mgnify:CR=1 FL=1
MLLSVLDQKISACGGQKLWVLSFYECKKAFLSFVKVSSRRAGAVPVVFYECRNARLSFAKVSIDRVCAVPVGFYKGRDARLLFAKWFCTRADVVA